MTYETHKKPELKWQRKPHMNRKTKFSWFGLHTEEAECEKVVIPLKGGAGHIKDHDILGEVITDPVKGHLWDLKKGKCLLHDFCDCELKGEVDVRFNLYGDATKVRNCMKKVSDALEEFWKNPY